MSKFSIDEWVKSYVINKGTDRECILDFAFPAVICVAGTYIELGEYADATDAYHAVDLARKTIVELAKANII